MVSVATLILITVVLIQWALITYIIGKRLHEEVDRDTENIHRLHAVPLFKSGGTDTVESTFGNDASKGDFPPLLNSQMTFDGVAATLMINAPKWFQRRYTSMVQNILDNTPSSWAIQIFYTPTGQSQAGLDINPGIHRMNLTHDRLIMTQIPHSMVKEFGMKRKKMYWTSEWMWQSMVAENVLVFGGNGALCSNSKLSLLDGTAMKLFERFDYIGTPWWNHGGEGGSGAISYRNRTAMLDALRDQPFDGNEAEDSYFINALKAMNKKRSGSGHLKYRIATKADTETLGGINSTDFREENGPPMIISGTLPRLEHSIRQVVLEMCPEVKRIFPSLHNPACFGAHPDKEGCAKTICALQDVHKGGC